MLAIAIEDQVSGDLIIRECLAEALADPGRCRIGSYADMKDRPARVVDDEEDVEDLEAHRWHSEEIHGSNAVSVVA